jgi:tetratricopeptide (TPR) repeat protein
MNSIIEAANELGLWDLAVSGALRIIDFSSGEPLTYLNLAKSSILEAEFYNLCEDLEVTKHRPSPEKISNETFNQLRQYLDNVKTILESYKTDVITNGLELTDDQIYRWEARADIAFKQYTDMKHNPVDILTHPLTPDDCAALIWHYHQIDLNQTESQSINKIIKIARTFPRNPSVMLQVALALYRDNPMDAMRSLQVVLEQHPYSNGPEFAFCNILLAKIALDSGEFDIAKDAVETAMNMWQNEPGWHMLAAQIYKRLSIPTVAIEHLVDATNLDLKNITYRLELGNMYFENALADPQLMKQALNSFERALELDPNNISSLVSLANTQFKLGDLVNAELNAQKALVIAPDRADLFQLLGEIMIRNGDFQRAYDYGNHAIQLNPKDAQSTILVARSLSAIGRNHEALLKINTMLPASQDSKILYLERVKIIQLLNGPKAGLEELQRLVESFPEDFTILTTLAQQYVDLGDTENAIITAQQALNVSLEKVSRNEQSSIHIVIGKLLRQTGQLDQSIFHLNEAIQLAPERLEPYLELGQARKERREYQEAIQLFEQATTIAPDDPRAPYQAGLALKESKDYRSSETMLRRAVNLAPNDLNIRRQLAAVVALNLVHNPRTGRNDGK